MADVKVVGVIFACVRMNGDRVSVVPHNKTVYHYLTDRDLKLDDAVVVESPSEGLVVVAVVTELAASQKATKWIVDKVDVSGFQERHRRRQEAVSLKIKLDQMVEAKRASQRYEEVLGDDPEAKKLIEQLKALEQPSQAEQIAAA